MDFVSKNYSFKKGERCIIIGEIGVNHNNDPDILFKLIDEAIAADVDIVKLQRFSSKLEISTLAPKADYQKKHDAQESQLEMAQKLELSDELIKKAFDYCREKEIGFLCAGFDHESVDFIADKLGCTTIKVPSPEITNKPLLEHISEKFDSVILSTGASNLQECLQAIEWVKKNKVKEVALMHCLSEYPAPLDEINLKAIETLKIATSMPVGYSDHTEGSLTATVAASLGAAMLEKHYTLDKNLPGPDHKASANINELKEIVSNVKKVHVMLGDGVKVAAKSEEKNRKIIRKSLVFVGDDLSTGKVLTKELLGVKRPYVEGAVSPLDLDKIIGMKLLKPKKYDEPIFWDDFK